MQRLKATQSPSPRIIIEFVLTAVMEEHLPWDMDPQGRGTRPEGPLLIINPPYFYGIRLIKCH